MTPIQQRVARFNIPIGQINSCPGLNSCDEFWIVLKLPLGMNIQAARFQSGKTLIKQPSAYGLTRNMVQHREGQDPVKRKIASDFMQVSIKKIEFFIS